MARTLKSVTFTVNKEHSLSDPSSGGNGGNSGDDHAPVGYYSSNGWTWKDLIRASLSFGGTPAGGWQFYEAELWLKTTSDVHVNTGGNPRLRVGRLTGAFTASGGGENSWGTTYGTVYPGPGVAGATTLPIHSGAQNTIVKLDITSVFEPWIPSTMRTRANAFGEAETNNGMRLESPDESSGGNTCEFYSMRGSYAPRFYVRYYEGKLPDPPALTSPSGVVPTAPTSFVGVATEAPVSRYQVQVGTDPTFASGILWDSGVSLATGISGATCSAAYAGSAQPLGVPIYWRMRTCNDVLQYGDWSAPESYTISSVGTSAITSPTADGLARIANLGEEVEWTNVGSHAKPEIIWRFNDPAGREATSVKVELFSDGSTLLQTETRTGSFPANTDLTLQTIWPIVRNTFYRIQVTPSVGSAVQTASGLRRFRVQWGQGIFTCAPGATASGHRFVYSDLTPAGTEARVAFLHRYRGGTTGPWKSTIGAAGTKQANWDILVRMGTKSTMPALPKMQAFWTVATATPPDQWIVGNGVILLDEGFRRFGVKSLKVTTLPSTVGYIAPKPDPTQVGVLVSGNTRYTVSAYINTQGAHLAGKVRPVIYSTGGTVIHDPGAADEEAATDYSGAHYEGWQRIYTSFVTPDNTERIEPRFVFGGGVAEEFWLDAVQLEEGSYASLWTPGLLGPQVVLDKGGIAVDASKGGFFRLAGKLHQPGDRYVVELFEKGLRYANDTELSSPSTGVLAVNTVPLSLNTHTHGGGTVVGAGTRNLGTATAAPLNASTPMPFGAPSAGEDPYGFFVASPNKLKIPVGMGGIYTFDVFMTGSVPAGNPVGTFAYAVCYLACLLPTTSEVLGRWDRYESGSQQGGHFSVTRPFVAGEELNVEALPRVVVGSGTRVAGWNIYRIATGL
jgi:hypothetical protein